MTQNSFKQMCLHERQFPLLGIASLLLGLIEVAFAIFELASLCYIYLHLDFIDPGSQCGILMSAQNSFLSEPNGGFFPLLCFMFPLIGPIFGFIGLLFDKKKVFSILGLTLLLISYILIIKYILDSHMF
jgi:hypothetical protein